MADRDLIDIQLLRWQDPGCFTGKEAPSTKDSTTSAHTFLEMEEEMNAYYGCDTTPIVKPDMKTGCICIGRSDGRWYRVKIETLQTTLKGCKASCWKLDYAAQVMIPLQYLREPIPVFLQVPFQAKRFKLYGIQPVTMVTNYEEMATTLQPCNTWDTSATEWINKLDKESTGRRIQSLGAVDENGHHPVRLYLDVPALGTVCVNDKLVENHWAQFKPPTPQKVPEPSAARRELSAQSDTEVHLERVCRRYQRPLTSVSDTEDSVGVRAATRRKKSQRGLSAISPVIRESPVAAEGSHFPLSPGRERTFGSSSEASFSPVRREKDPPTSKGRGRGNIVNILSELTSNTSKTTRASPVQASPVEAQAKASSDSDTVVPAGVKKDAMASVLPLPMGRGYLSLNTDPPVSVKNVLTKGSTSQETTCSSIGPGRGRGLFQRNLLDSLLNSPSSSQSSTPTRPVRDQNSPSPVLGIKPASSPDSATEESQQKYLSRLPKHAQQKQQETLRVPGQLEKSSLKGQGHPERSPSRSSQKSPQTVRFSDTDEVFDLSNGSPVSRGAQSNKLPKSIIKKASPQASQHNSSGSELDTSVAESPQGRPARLLAAAAAAGDEEEEGEMLLKRSPVTHPQRIAESNQLLALVKGKGSLSKGFFSQLVEEIDPDMDDPQEQSVFADNRSKLRSWKRLDKLPFFEYIKKTPSLDQTMQGPRTLQMFAWPAISRGQDLAGVAPSRQGQTAGGKTYSYLLPLVHALNQPAIYADLPQGSGALLVVICPSWKKAAEVFQQTEELLQKHRRIHAMLLTGGIIVESALEIPLVNGCQVLVCTPHSLLRMLNKDVTSLNRCCHLVLEDADVLTEEFKPQIQSIMESYATALKDQEDICVPRQKLIFAQQWTLGMEAFTKQFMSDPIVLIASKREAAFYGGVKQVPIVSTSDNRLSQLADVAFDGSMKTVIFTEHPSNATHIYKVLQSQSCFCLLAQPSMETDIGQVQREWDRPRGQDSLPVLVMDDSTLRSEHLDISDAERVIHFDIPRDKFQFGNRLWCMRKKFVSPFDEKPKPDSESQGRGIYSHLFITEQCGSQAHNLLQLLQHYNAPIPLQLRQLAEQAFETKEKSKRRELCPYLKSFGWCREEKKCKFRHIVLRSLDSPTGLLASLPSEGQIKVLITLVEDAGCYYGRLLSCSKTPGEVVDLTETHTQLLESHVYYAAPSRRQYCQAVPSEGQLYAHENTQHICERVEIMKLSRKIKGGIPHTVTVRYIDQGGYASVKTTELLELPEQFKHIPPQAVEIRICCVRPMDEDVEWTERAGIEVSEKIFGRELEGKIVLVLGNTVWVDPLVERKRLEGLNTPVNEYNVRRALFEQGMAQQNPLHVRLLYAACEKQMELSQYKPPEKTTERAYTTQGRLVTTLPTIFPKHESDGYVKVYVTAVCSPDLLYLQLQENDKKWQALDEEIHTLIRCSIEDEREEVRDLRKGMLVLAKFSIDQRWYRAKVMEVTEEGTYDIFLVDTGESDYVESCDIRPLPMRLLTLLPFQALECTLIGIESTEEEWPETVGDLLWDLTTHTETNGRKLMYAQVRGKSEARNTGLHRYGVRLFDVSRVYDVNLAQLLVAKGCAKPDSTLIQEICYTDSDNSPVSQIHGLCASLLATQVADQQVSLAQQVIGLVTDASSEEISKSEAHKCLCTTLVYVTDPRVIDLLVKCITGLARGSERLSTEMCTAMAVNTLCYFLDDKEKMTVEVHHTLILALQAFAEHEACRQDVIVRSLQILCEMLVLPESNLVHEAVSKTLSLALTEDTTRDNAPLIARVCVENVCDSLKQTSQVDVQYNLLCVLKTLAHHNQLKDLIRKHKGLKCVCQVAESSSSVKLLERCAKVLRALASNNRFNKDAMNDLDMISTLQRLSANERLSLESKKICSDLRDRLHSVKPSALHRSSPNKLASGSPRGVNRSPVPSPAQSPGRGIISLARGRGLCSLIGTPQVNGQHMPLEGIRPLGNSQVINNKPLPPSFCSSVHPLCRRSPRVLWVQDKSNILLTVKVPLRKVPDARDIVRLTEDHVHFRVVADSTEYAFDWHLYEVIVPDECQVAPRSSETYIGLRKASRGCWPRLCKAKQKIPNLEFDVSRYVDSSSETEESDDVSANPPLSLAKRNIDRKQYFESSATKVLSGVTEEQVAASFATGGGSSDTDTNSSAATDEDILDRPYDPFEQEDNYNFL